MEMSSLHASHNPSLLDQVAAPKPQPEVPLDALEPLPVTAADQPCMVSFATTQAPPNAQAFLDLPASTTEAIASFFAGHQGESATTMVRSGTSYVLSVGGETIKMDYKALAASLKDGKLPPNSPLGVSLLVFDVASRSHLPQAAIRTVLGQMRQGLAAGQSPQQVMQSGYHNVVLATQVEAYARHKDGLSFDQRRVASTGPSVVTEEQHHLEAALHAFREAYGKAQESGNYAHAFDTLQTFLQQGSTSTSVPHWKGRSDKLASDLAVPEPEKGLGEEVMDEIKHALMSAIDNAIGTPDSGKPAGGEGALDAVDRMIARKTAERAALRQAFQAKYNRDDPRVTTATAKAEASVKGLEMSARFLASRGDDELRRTFEEVADGLSQWSEAHSAKSDFERDYAQDTIDYLLLMDHFADGLEALKEGREPHHRSTMLPPDAVDQPEVLASFIEAIAARVAAATAPGPKLDEGILGRKPELIAESLRAIIEACRLAV
jgi:AcrR family transcriptional regulator